MAVRHRHATRPVLLARALADALLAGLPTPRGMRDRAIDTLGHTPSWLPALIRRALRVHAADWHPNRADALAATIVGTRGFPDGVTQPVPPVRHRHFNAPVMRLPPWSRPLLLPDLPTPGDLAYWLGVPVGALDSLADLHGLHRRPPSDRVVHYVRRWVPKAHGGARLIEAPKERLRQVQRRLLDGLLVGIPLHEAAHGFRARHSCLTHAQLHSGRAVVVRLDLEEFFTHLTRARVRGFFASCGFPSAVAQVLAGLCTTPTPRVVVREAPISLTQAQGDRLRMPHLPQGAPTSPALANLCAFGLDVRLDGLAQALGARYSRYADDLVFSGDRGLPVDGLIVRAMAIARDEGFAVNARKTRVMRAAQQQRVTGLVVNTSPNVPRVAIDRLRATLYNCVRDGPSLHNRAAHPNFRAHLQGRVAQVRSVHAARGERLARLLAAIDWSR